MNVDMPAAVSKSSEVSQLLRLVGSVEHFLFRRHSCRFLQPTPEGFMVKSVCGVNVSTRERAVPPRGV
ncbi:hypothetical protein BD309DRAFT_966277 [Dichomitus squalens]|uniref:Uncharacterized protein n=1 Tax=Dichomitus squalens TaxID=114155 RepID=A0A4Q9NJE9_9APHY|nr:hypothetical protein BD309DRAFT_966277 [Dichomitus squalens]TBU53270.1 hypothetical protein BD310DRAFT_938421 [Dichomitus squalens]